MADYCTLCNKKIGFFTTAYYVLKEKYLVCDECHETVQNVIHEDKGEQEFEKDLQEFCEKFAQNPNLDKYVTCFREKFDEVLIEQRKKEQIEREKQLEAIEREGFKRERIQRKNAGKIENLREIGCEGYYEYKVVNFYDNESGTLSYRKIEEKLNELGLDGWHLICVYNNETGINSLRGGIGGISTGVNSTMDDNILIFERFVRIKENDM